MPTGHFFIIKQDVNRSRDSAPGHHFPVLTRNQASAEFSRGRIWLWLLARDVRNIVGEDSTPSRSETLGPLPLNRMVRHATAATIRDATDSDMDGVRAVYAHYVTSSLATFEEVPPSAEDMTRRRAGVLEAGLPWLVAELDGQIAGYAYAGPYRLRPAYRFTVEDSIYVADGFSGQGIGGALLAELVRRCEAGPWRQMVAVIGNSRNEACVALHRALGFSSTGTLNAVGFKFGQWVDTVLMQRPLGEGEWSLPRD